MAEASLLTIHTDGASRGNPGAAAYAYVIASEGRDPIEEAGCLGEMTNNQAEYTALVKALEHALRLGPQHRVIVNSDSELMVKQLRGEYRVKNEELRPLYEQARRLRDRFQQPVTFRHVRREHNRRADELCNEALDGLRGVSRPPVPVVPLPVPSKPETALQPPTAKKAAEGSLREQALACLSEAAATWVKSGNPRDPTPEEVWRQLAALLQKHWTQLLDG
jgi:ribonuclease HI